MKTRVISNETPVRLGLRDLSKVRGAHSIRSVIKAPWARSLVSLGMTVSVVWLLLPKPPLLDGVSFSQCVRDRDGKLLRVTLTSDQKFRIWTSLRDTSIRRQILFSTSGRESDCAVPLGIWPATWRNTHRRIDDHDAAGAVAFSSPNANAHREISSNPARA